MSAPTASVTLIRSCGTRLDVVPDESVLEAFRRHRIPHAAVCGGKARCTTCRVRMMEGQDRLPPPGPAETEALARIGAPPEVRLACQIRPRADLAVMPLLPADASLADIDGITLDGRECLVTVVFVDLRDSTRLAEARLPFDVLFILNRFFLEMNRAIVASGGHYSNFTGDGLMALYGHDGSEPAPAARAALAGVTAMSNALERVNHDLATELPAPLRVGIGVHAGLAIVGSMGPPGAQILSAIGDTVNTAARLESLSKELGHPLVVSRRTVELAGMAGLSVSPRMVRVKGRDEPVEVYALDRLPSP